MAFFTVNTVDTETEGDLEKTATPTHPSRSMRRRGEDATHFSTPVNTLANRRMDSLRPSPKACISHHGRPLPPGPLCLKSPRIWH
ncbi:hypothetical protein CgunFtcFv8_015281 [Champsocephalus gunnari]|uniref:Uncharacterized protein n=1 Tax=Champsocephalus gunnari TaxID=52237 RepID=A0AAN8C660_CHAGU|nr:hypothetical protein CgunFtcFv8_015281 [Champsocephalus gunnari]